MSGIKEPSGFRRDFGGQVPSMKDPIKYYQDEFGRELLEIKEAETGSAGDRISIVSLLPVEQLDRPRTEPMIEVFQRLPYKHLFLFCYFFSALVDQATHFSLREEHPYFDRLARYPKFVGILGTYWTNLHPGLLLLAATLYIEPDEWEFASHQFRDLADFFVNDYEEFWLKTYPNLTGRLKKEKERRNAVNLIFRAISNALARLFLPRSLSPYSKCFPVINLYEDWVKYFSHKINDKL
jgi:hypothetical protein